MYAESVQTLAGRMGLPPLLVDLRHESTHNKVLLLDLDFLHLPLSSFFLVDRSFPAKSPPFKLILALSIVWCGNKTVLTNY